jgi:hypothetical protein
MDHPLYIVHQVVLDPVNDPDTETKIIGIYTSIDNAIDQMSNILKLEYKKFIKNDDDLKYSTTECNKICTRNIKKLIKHYKCESIFNDRMEYRIQICNAVDKIVGLQY